MLIPKRPRPSPLAFSTAIPLSATPCAPICTVSARPSWLLSAPRQILHPSSRPSRRFVCLSSLPKRDAAPVSAAQQSPSSLAVDAPKRKRVISPETRRKISYSMLGVPKSKEMREKVSAKLRGRVPWNKGKKLSAEIKRRMSIARQGNVPWNKGIHLSKKHRDKISARLTGKKVSGITKQRMRMARRRPADGIVSGNGRASNITGEYPLVEGGDINVFVSLRRELRAWSDTFYQRHERRPTLHDIRRLAPVPVVRKFERYVSVRQRLRGLASDVCGKIDPTSVPVLPSSAVSQARAANVSRQVRMTKYGNPRLVSQREWEQRQREKGAAVGGAHDGNEGKHGMWDRYDTPKPLSVGDAAQHTLIGAHEIANNARTDSFCANDYRKIGRYRLMETMDINRYVKLRKELEQWSAAFKKKHGRTPSLSDTQVEGKTMLYDRFCEYLRMRDSMSGLMKEVYGTDQCDVETIAKVNREGKVILNALRSGAAADNENENENENNNKSDGLTREMDELSLN